MTDADELAQRYLALWTEYLTALLADPRAMETLKRWMEFAGQFSYPGPDRAQALGAPFPVWPPFFGPFGLPAAPSAGAETSTHDEQIAKLACRVEALERRLAALERRLKPRRPTGAGG